MLFIDTHCHLNFSDFADDLSAVIGNAKKAGVKQCIVPGVDYHSSNTAVALAQQYPGVLFASVGYHPYEASGSIDITHLRSLLEKQKNTHDTHTIVAIGECGLDYHRYRGEQAAGKKDQQKQLLSEHLELARIYHLPVVLHCRDAWADIFDVIDSQPVLPRAVFHCFSGGLQEIRMAQERKFFIGIDGNITYSEHIASRIPSIPLSMLLLETDAPNLTPVPNRGKRNEPKYLRATAAYISQILGMPLQQVAEATSQNARALFGLATTTLRP